MKNKYINLLWILITSITLGFISCSSDEDSIVIEKAPELNLDNIVRINVGSTMSIPIIEGSGQYKVFSLNEAIAEAELVDSNIIINAISNGKTSLVISDKSSQYKQVTVISLYDEIVLDTTNLDFKKRLGHDGTQTITVLKGNGSYVAKSDNEEIATASVNQNKIVVKAFKEGSVNIKIKDAFDIETVASVVVTETTDPYGQEELDEILKDDERRYVFQNKQDIYWYAHFNTFENDMNKYGWYNWGDYLYIYFPGNKEVGVKEGSLLSYAVYGPVYTDEPINFEIIKNDGKKIWAIFSFIKDDKLEYGYFVDTIEKS